MIPGLLHGRVLGAPSPGGGPVAAPVYQQQLAYASGTSSASAIAQLVVNPDGTWTTSGTGYSGQSGLWYDPASSGVGSAYEVKITATNTGGSSGAVNNGAGDWQALSASRALEIGSSRYTTGSSIAYYSVRVQIRSTSTGAIVSDGSFNVTVTAQVQASGGGGNGGCPALDMWLGQGVQAGEVKVGQRIDGVTSDDPDSKVRLPVLRDQVSRQPCYRIVTSAGAACVLSDSTPFTLRDGSTVYAGQMLGQQVLRDDGAGGLVWDEVVQCYPVGELDVVKISVGGHSLLAGEHPAMRIVSHNQQKN